MDDLIQKMKAGLRHREKKPARKLPPGALRDPQMGLPFAERRMVPATWSIRPGELQQFVSDPGMPEQDASRAATSSTVSAQKMASEEMEKIHHIYSRASFGLSVAEALASAGTSLADHVDALLTAPSDIQPPGEWVTEPFDIQAFESLTPEQQMAFIDLNFERMYETRKWWLERMMASPRNLTEKMTLFWHGHFTSDFDAAILAQHLYKQNATLRQFALGNFRDFLKAIYKDPTMLVYLDGWSNVASAPNENFARELLELFTLGVGNYTETDIKEAARAFTGWQIDFFHLKGFFNPVLHDHGEKTFLGQTGQFDGDDIIDIILQQPRAATFICTQLHEFFVSREPDEAFVAELANTLRDGDYELAPVVRQMLLSDQFYSQNAVASLIKSPVDLTVSNARMLSSQEVNLLFVFFSHALLDQELMNPPNVAGWPGQRSWISPTTYVWRNTISEIYVDSDFAVDQNGNPFVVFYVMKFAQSFNLPGARELAAAMVSHLLRFPPSEETFEFLLTVLLGSAAEEDWSLNYQGVEKLLTKFLVQVLRTAEFQLN